MLDIILLAMLSAYLFYKLYQVLGDTNFDNYQSDEKRERLRKFAENYTSDKINTKKELIQTIEIVSATEAELPQEFRNIFDEIRKHDHKFSADSFIEKAKSAYEYIVGLFSEGDTESLSKLLDNELLESFNENIKSYKDQGYKLNIQVIGFKGVSIYNVKKIDNDVYVQVKFESDQIRRPKLRRHH
jgi:predicted lipid-binding transport protein (Tim44 family)